VHGAHVVAQLLADALCEEIPVLQKYRVSADITVDKRGRGDYLTLQPAVEKALMNSKKETTIQILGGEWEKPQLPKKHHVKFVLREGATWK
jgi:hypothetical protein